MTVIGMAKSLMRITSYNVLAQTYVRSAIFTHSPGASLKWRNRSRTLLATLEKLDSDVLALQEVDQYADFWAHWLRRRGYGGVWKCRTSLTNKKKDGCGLFFKKDKFDLLAKREIEYNDIAFGRPVGYDATTVDASADGGDGPETIPSTEESQQPYIRDCVGVLALLRAKTNQAQTSSSSAAAADEESPRTVLVASTHLFWDPRHADVKLAQAERLLAEAGKFLEDNKVRLI